MEANMLKKLLLNEIPGIPNYPAMYVHPSTHTALLHLLQAICHVDL